jgi:crossover junction endodeoxyribonuclease RuvC
LNSKDMLEERCFKIGIDPGITGALSCLEDGKIADLCDMPVIELPSGKHQVNAAQLAKILTAWKDNSIVILERVSAMPGQGVSSMFNFGMGYGIIQGVVMAIGIPMTLVSPQVWKKKAGLIGKDKDYARTLAQQLWPSAELGRKKDIGKADALLIAKFG